MASLTLDPRVTQTPANGTPVDRMTAEDRVTMYDNNSDYLLTKNTPFTPNSTLGFGPKQPFIYVFANESTIIKNFTYFDTRPLPVGSVARDAKRIGQYLITNSGIAYLGLQALLQQQNAFNETRVYNPASVLKAVVRPGSLGSIDRPIRHVPGSGGPLNLARAAVSSTFGGAVLGQSLNSSAVPIEGTATGDTAGTSVPWSTYAGIDANSARSGFVRFGTANAAINRFNRYWIPPVGPTNPGGFLENLGRGLVDNLKSSIPSTNPLGALNGTVDTKWVYRPEYLTGKQGVYYIFRSDTSGMFSQTVQKPSEFYNTGPSQEKNLKAKNFHPYYPKDDATRTPGSYYADSAKVSVDAVGTDGGLRVKYNRMLAAMTSAAPPRAPQLRASAHMYNNVVDSNGIRYKSYNDIPRNPTDPNYYSNASAFRDIKMDKKGFLKNPRGSGIYDEYNKLPVIKGKRGTVPTELLMQAQTNQSKDLIFFYFFDLINKMYVPFRATVKNISDQNTPDIDTIPYLGRADRLYLYKGFTRDTTVSFEVYANSVTELIPMWKRINYLVGLTRPSKYTGKASTTGIEQGVKTTGRESSFIYPPMITLRIGDLFVDQPCIISNCSVSIPQETNWETLRSDSNYSYEYSATKQPYSLSDSMDNDLRKLQAEQASLLRNVDNISAFRDNVNGQQAIARQISESARMASARRITDGKPPEKKETAFVRQLPMRADITVNLKLFEKERAETGNDLYGFNMKLAEG